MWLVWTGLAILYGLPVTLAWSFEWHGHPSRPPVRRWAVASVVAVLWLPALAWAYAGLMASHTPAERAALRRQGRQLNRVDGLIRELDRHWEGGPEAVE